MHADTFPSRVDAWLVVVVAGGIVAALAGAVAALESSPAESLPGFGVTAFMLLVIVLVGVPCEYTLAGDHLLIRSGIVRQRIRYADNETNYCARCQTGGKLLADRSLSRLLHKDWPKTLDELEMLAGSRR